MNNGFESKVKGFILKFTNLVRLSAEQRIVRDNGKNDQSSRSHYVFQVRITHNEQGVNQKTSTLSIVDLAGSERRENPYN